MKPTQPPTRKKGGATTKSVNPEGFEADATTNQAERGGNNKKMVNPEGFEADANTNQEERKGNNKKR